MRSLFTRFRSAERQTQCFILMCTLFFLAVIVGSVQSFIVVALQSSDIKTQTLIYPPSKE